MEYQLVKLVAISQPQIENNGSLLTADEFIAYTARVSNPSNQLNTHTAQKLIGYLIENEHWSPFEMVSLTMEIKTTRDIGRQILRHRSFSFQEFSQRYATVAADFATREARLQDTKNRQNSIDIDDPESEVVQWWKETQQNVAAQAEAAYLRAIRLGVAKEQARAVLPEGMTMSTLYMSGTLRSWIHYCQLRMAHGTQKEHVDIANKAWEVICEKFPSIREYYLTKSE